MIRCQAIGESCLSWTLGERPGVDLSNRILAHYRHIKQQAPEGVLDVVPAFTELAVHFDPDQLSPEDLQKFMQNQFEQNLSAWREQTEPKSVVLEVVYDGEDLDAVATKTGLSVKEVIRRHAEPIYTVAMIGFLPHFPYCLGLDEALITSRRSSPRSRVPAGSVAIAGEQTGVYPCESPGGWNLLGHTDPSVLSQLSPGDRLRFVPGAGSR